jgi:trk system potassium uptake protein TrkA
MKIIIVGAGMIGLHIARELIEEKRDIVIIEKDPDVARRAGNDLDCMVLNEDGSRPETLRKAGAANADWFLALTGSDEVNIVACGMVAAESSTIRTVARVTSPFYSSLSKAQRDAFGLDVLINPTAETANAVDHFIREGFAEDIMPLHEGRLQLRLVASRSLPMMTGKTLAESRATTGTDVLVAAVARARGLVIPRGDFIVEANDSLYLIGTPASLDSLLGQVASVKSTAKRVLVIGATIVSERIVEKLHERSKAGFFGRLMGTKRRITVMDSSSESTKRIARLFQDVDIVQGDSSDEGLLEQAGVDKADLVICATASQSFNIITAQLAKSLGAEKSVAITLNDRYSSLGSSLDVDALISVKGVVAAAILELVRRANIRTVHDFYEDDVELVELRISAGSPVAGRELVRIDIPKGVLVAYVIRDETMIVPTGATRLEGGDSIGIVSRKADISGLERVFGGGIGN